MTSFRKYTRALTSENVWQTTLRSDIGQALTKKCGSSEGALPQITVGRVDTCKKTVLIEYCAAKRTKSLAPLPFRPRPLPVTQGLQGFDPHELAAEIQLQVSNSSSRLKLRGKVTGRALQHNFSVSKFASIARHLFNLLKRILFEWQQVVAEELHERTAQEARDRAIAAQDMFEQASEQVKAAKERLMHNSKKTLLKMLHSHLAAAFDAYVSRVQENQDRRARVTRVLRKMQNIRLARSFETYQIVVSERVKNRLAINRVLQQMLCARRLRSFQVWIEYMEIRRAEINEEAHELAKRELAGELDQVKASSQDLLQREFDRRVEICKRTVSRMLAANLARAFESFEIRVAETRKNRRTCQRVIKRMMLRQMAGAFDLFHSAAIALREQKKHIAKAISRWENVGLKVSFAAWLEYKSGCELERKWSAYETVQQKLKGDFELQKTDFEKQVEQEKERRKNICKSTVRRMLAGTLANAWDSYVKATQKRIDNRAIVLRVLQRVQHRQLASGFDQYTSAITNHKAQVASVARVISKMLHARLCWTFDAWHEFQLEAQDERRNSVDQAAQRMLSQELAQSVDNHKQAVQREAQRREEVCRRMLKRMLAAQQAKSFSSFADAVFERISRRNSVNRVLKKMYHAQLGAAFGRYSDVVSRTLAGRRSVNKVINRMQKAGLCSAFNQWLDAIEIGRMKIQEDGLELAKQRMSAEFATEKDQMQAERDRFREAAEREASRRLEVCKKTVKRLLSAHLAKSFSWFADTVSERIHRRRLIKSVLGRMQHAQLAAAFDRYSDVVARTLASRAEVSKVIGRMQKAKLFAAFGNWLEYHDLVLEEIKQAGGELAQQQISNVQPWSPWQLKIALGRAQHLPKMDMMGSVDPYVIFSHGSREQKSSVVKNDYNPEWNQEFVFEIQSESDEQEELILTIMDKNKLAKDTAVGEIRLDVASLSGKSSFRTIGMTAPTQGTPASWRKPHHNFGQVGAPVLGKDGQQAIVTLSMYSSNLKLGDEIIEKSRALEIHNQTLTKQVEAEKRRRVVMARRVVMRMLNSQLAESFEIFFARLEEIKRARAVVSKAIAKMLHARLVFAFESWNVVAIDAKKSLTKAAEDEAKILLQQMLKVERDRNKEKSEALQREADRKMEVCRRLLTRMLKAQLARAFLSFVDTVSERIHRRRLIKSVLGRMQHAQLAAAFDRYSDVVARTLASRAAVSKVIGRMQKAKLFTTFSRWLDYVQGCRIASAQEAVKLARERMGGDIAAERDEMRRERDSMVQHEKARRMDVCRRMVRRMLNAQLSQSWDLFVETLVRQRYRRELVKRVIQRVRYAALVAAFDRFDLAVDQSISEREAVSKAITRWRMPTLQWGLDLWVRFVELRHTEMREEDIESARQAMADELDKSIESSRSLLHQERQTREELLYRERARRLEICKRSIRSMLLACLAKAFDLYRHRTIQCRDRRHLSSKIVRRLLNIHLSAALHGFAGAVQRAMENRVAVARVIRRIQFQAVAKAFDRLRFALAKEKKDRRDEAWLQKQNNLLTDVLAGTVIGKVLSESTLKELALSEAAKEKKALMLMIVEQETKLADLERHFLALSVIATRTPLLSCSGVLAFLCQGFLTRTLMVSNVWG